MTGVISVVVDGVTFGMLLFLFSIGLSITLGLMRFINLAHGAFAMFGGYVSVTLLNGLGMPFLVTLPVAFLATGIVGAILERSVIRHVYRMPELQQVLFSIGLAFAAGAIATIIFGPQQQPILLPRWLTEQMLIFDIQISGYRIFLIVAGFSAAAGLIALFNYTMFGAKIRAAVDNRRTAEGMGIDVNRLFSLTFALGAACAGFGGALAVGFLGLDPTFPLKYLVLVLMVVAIGGPGSIGGSFIAAIFLGVVDALFKYFVPEVGGFVIYALLVVMMIFFPKGIARRTA